MRFGFFARTAFSLAVCAATTAAADAPGRVGFALTVWDSAFVESRDGKAECPDGLQFNEKDQWQALPEEKRAELNKKFGFRWNRGPNGENGITSPAALQDPLPFREVQSKVSYGFDLDGTKDGAATRRTCQHAKFDDADGGGKVDHQMYRVLGCAQGMRIGGFQREWVAKEFQTQPVNRVLLQLEGVDSLENDKQVELRFYKGFDGLPSDAGGKFLAGATHRVDDRFPMLFSAKGRIENGVLISEPVEMGRFPIKWIQALGTRNIFDMRLRLQVNQPDAKGLVGGYEDIEEHWNMWRRGASGSQDISSWSGSSIYKAMKRLADGRPDPKTGQCTAISVAYRIEAVRANIVYPRTQVAAKGVSIAAERELKGY